MMHAEQAVFFPSYAQERLEAVEAMLQDFLNWHGAQPFDGDRKPVEWFAHKVAGYFENKNSIDWDNV